MSSEVQEHNISELRFVSAKLRALAYLIENHRDEAGEPLDIDDIHWGIGLLLTDLSGTVKSLAIEMDKASIKLSQRKKS